MTRWRHDDEGGRPRSKGLTGEARVTAMRAIAWRRSSMFVSRRAAVTEPTSGLMLCATIEARVFVFVRVRGTAAGGIKTYTKEELKGDMTVS